jgi:hypothetical protein
MPLKVIGGIIAGKIAIASKAINRIVISEIDEIFKDAGRKLLQV